MSKIDFSAHEQWWNIAKYIYSNSVLVHNIEILVDYCGGKYRTSYSLLYLKCPKPKYIQLIIMYHIKEKQHILTLEWQEEENLWQT